MVAALTGLAAVTVQPSYVKMFVRVLRRARVTTIRPLFTPAPKLFSTTLVSATQAVAIAGSPPARADGEIRMHPAPAENTVTETAPERGLLGRGVRLIAT